MLPLHGVHSRVLLRPEQGPCSLIKLCGAGTPARQIRLSRSCVSICSRTKRSPDPRLWIALCNVINLVGGNVRPSFFRSAQPAHFQIINLCRCTKANMYPMAILRQIRRAADSAPQSNSAYPCNHCCAVAKSDWLSACRGAIVKSQLNPVTMRNVIAEKPYAFALIHNGDVHCAIVVIV